VDVKSANSGIVHTDQWGAEVVDMMELPKTKARIVRLMDAIMVLLAGRLGGHLMCVYKYGVVPGDSSGIPDLNLAPGASQDLLAARLLAEHVVGPGMAEEALRSLEAKAYRFYDQDKNRYAMLNAAKQLAERGVLTPLALKRLKRRSDDAWKEACRTVKRTRRPR
jgi:hypothetical protein